jgi:hypothetical protein
VVGNIAVVLGTTRGLRLVVMNSSRTTISLGGYGHSRDAC